MPGEAKNYVRDLTNKEMVDKNVFDKEDGEIKILSPETEQLINDNVEKAYQDFVKTIDLTNMSNKQIEQVFNIFMDEVDRILDEEKRKKIENSVNPEIDTALRNLEFTLQLEALQVSIQEERENEAEAITLKNGIKIDGLLANQVSKEQLNTLCDTINTTNFKEKKYIVECLNRGSKEDIRRIQYLLVGKKDEYVQGKGGNKIGVLSKFGTDGLMGSETYNALLDYVTDTDNVEANPTNNPTSNPTNNPTSNPTNNPTGNPDEITTIEHTTETTPIVIDTEVPNPIVVNPTSNPDEITTIEPTTEVSTDETEDSGGNVVINNVQYDTSLTMSRENYERRVENAKNERDAIRRLLGLKGFSNQTRDISFGIEGYTVKKLSEEWYDLVKLKESLLGFQKTAEKDYRLVYCFQSIVEQYQSGKDPSKIEIAGKKDDQGNWINVKDPYVYTYFDKLRDSYIKYKEGNGGAYFNYVMGSLENLFIRGSISVDDVTDNLFIDFFEKNNYGVARGGVDFDKLNIDFDNTDGSRDKIRYNEKGEKEFIAMLSDFNLDGRLDHNDRGYYMGLELDNLYKSINIDFQSPELSEQIESGQSVRKNIVKFAIDYFEELGEADLANKLKGVNNIDDLNKALKEKDGENGYVLLKSLQNMIRYSSVPLSFILKYGNKEKASSMFLNEAMDDPSLNEMYNAAFDSLVEQGLDPQLRMGLKPIILGSYINNGFGGGLGVAYDTKNIGSFSLSLGVTNVPGQEEPQIGIIMGWNSKTYDLGRGWTLSGHTTGGASLQKGFLLMGGLKTSKLVNEQKLNQSLKARPENRIAFGPNVGWVYNTGFILGASLGIDRNFERGIETQFNNIKSEVSNLLMDMLDDEGFKGFISNGKIDTSKQDEIKSWLNGKLTEKFGSTDSELLEKSSANLYLALLSLCSGLDMNEQDENKLKIAKTRLANSVADLFANQRRDNAIENLNGQWKLTGASVGIAYVLSLSSFVATGGVRVSKYGNMFSSETEQSEAIYNARLATGLGMDYLEGSVYQNGNITKEAINYLNNKLSIIGNYNIAKMGIRFETIDSNGPKNILYIPRDLFNCGVNMYLDPKLKDYISSDENGFKVPVNTEIALLTRSGTSSTQFDLIIGNHRKDPSAIQLLRKSNFEGHPIEYQSEISNGKVFNVDKINESMSDLYSREDFPLSSCRRNTDGKLTFVMKDGKTVSIDNELHDKDGNIVLSSYGKLVIKKGDNGEYSASFTPINEEKMIIEYNDGTEVFDGNSGYSLDMSEEYDNLNKLFDSVETRLSKLDDNQWGNYADFMDYASDMIDGVLDENDYGRAFDMLKYMLSSKLSSRDLSDTNLSALKEKIDEGNLSNIEKTLIVDRFKMIFSYHINLSDGNHDYDNLFAAINGYRPNHESEWVVYPRGNTYKKLTGYNGKVPPLNGDYRGEILKQLKGSNKLEKEPRPNLIGMTAFYRFNKDGRRIKEGRGYSMTEIGHTTVLGGAYEEITDESLKERFISNLKVSEAHKAVLNEVITKKIQSILGLDSLTISNDDIIGLLEGKELDISGKKFTINTKFMFYLLGECGNESIGVNIENITVKGLDGNGNGNSVTIEPGQSYEGLSGVYVGSAEASNRYNIQRTNNISLAFATSFGGEGGGHSTPSSGGGNSTPNSGGQSNNANNENPYGP